MSRRKVLLFGEALTLAHAVRLVSIGKALDPALYEIHFACDPRYEKLIGPLPFVRHQVESMPPAEFQRAISAGSPIFSEPRLEGYIEADLALLSSVNPDVVLGDFRISLGISARVSRVPYVCLTNAYWSPYARIRHVVPEITVSRRAGRVLGQFFFDLFRGAGYAIHMTPVNRLRRRFGLRELPGDFRHALVDGDVTCFSDIPEVIPMNGSPSHHRFIGPVPWSPDIDRPGWWGRLTTSQDARPLIYVTLGSSGPPDAVATVVDAVDALNLRAVVATAGGRLARIVNEHIFVAPFVPGDLVSSMASLVVSNGGSPTTYQALSAGRPVVGIATNMDQFLNMAAVEDRGLGVLVRSGRLRQRPLAAIFGAILEDRAMAERARETAVAIGACDWQSRARNAIESVMP